MQHNIPPRESALHERAVFFLLHKKHHPKHRFPHHSVLRPLAIEFSLRSRSTFNRCCACLRFFLRTYFKNTGRSMHVINVNSKWSSLSATVRRTHDRASSTSFHTRHPAPTHVGWPPHYLCSTFTPPVPPPEIQPFDVKVSVALGRRRCVPPHAAA